MKRILFIILSLIVFACEMEIEVEVPFEEPKLTANCWFTTDGNWWVRVSKSKSILNSSDYIFIANANVKIYEYNRLVAELIHKENGWYSFADPYQVYNAVPGREYNLKVSVPGFPTLEANEKLSGKPEIDTIIFDKTNLRYEYELSGYKLIVRINDSPVDDNYYHLLLTYDHILSEPAEINGINYSEGDTIHDVYAHFHASEILDIRRCHNWSMFFSDKEFDGELYDLEVIISSYVRDHAANLKVNLNAISRNYFQAAYALEQNRN